MGHTKGGGIGNMAGSLDDTRDELIAEIRKRFEADEFGTYATITEDELKRLTGETMSGRETEHELMMARLRWVAAAKPGQQWPDKLFGELDEWNNGWGGAMSAMAEGALTYIARLEGFNAQLMETLTWRPIAEAPIPGPAAVTQYWTFPCLLQTVRGTVGEGFARWVEDGRMKGAREACVLRWYHGAADRGRDTRVCHDPKYFMPLPAKRED